MGAWSERRTSAVLILGAVTALSVYSLTPTFVRQPVLGLGYVLVDVGFTATALLLARQHGQRGNARLAALIAASSLLSHLLVLEVAPSAPALLAAGSLSTALTQVLVAALILRYPRERLGRWGTWWVVANLATAVALGCAALLAGVDRGLAPGSTGSWRGPWTSDSASAAVVVATAVWRLLAAASFLTLLVVRWRRGGVLERRTLAPVVAAAVFAAVIVAVPLQPVRYPAASAVVVAVRSFAGAAVSLAFLASALRQQLARGAVGTLATALAGPTTPTLVRDALRTALADPTLEIAYREDDRDTWVDGEGGVVDPPHADRRHLVAFARAADGRPLAAVTADASLARHGELVRSAIAVSQLALENARLQARLSAQLAEVQEARARLLRSGFEQRRQLERDLHDGAQQRLLAVGMRLAAVEGRTADPATAAAVAAAKAELHEALAELRDLAHGLHPVVLSQGGLGAALDAVAERLPLVVRLTVPERRWAPEVEGVAYLVVCEALTNAVKHARAGSADVVVSLDAPAAELVVSVTDDGSGWPADDHGPRLPELADRLAALGGHLDVRSGPGGTTVAARIPVDAAPGAAPASTSASPGPAGEG